jgi:RNA polymerase sigma factor for flagellar operon FliA
MRFAVSRLAAYNCEANNEGQETDLAQNIPGPPDQDPLTLYLVGECKQRLQEAIAHLPEREQQVLMLYYQQELTMCEVGELMGVGESRVSQIHTLAVEHLRSTM